MYGYTIHKQDMHACVNNLAVSVRGLNPTGSLLGRYALYALASRMGEYHPPPSLRGIQLKHHVHGLSVTIHEAGEALVGCSQCGDRR